MLEAATIVSTLYYVKTTRQIWLPNITGPKSPWIPTRGRWTTWWHWTTEQVGFATIVWTPSGGKSEPDWLQRGPPSRTSKGRSWRPRHYVQQLLQGMRTELRRRLDWHLNKLFWGNIELINHLVGIMAQLFYCTSILFSYKIMMAQLFKDRPKYYLDWRSSSFENEILDPNAAEACHGWLQPPYYALDHTLINVVEN